MNIFEKIVTNIQEKELTLGNPLHDETAIQRRLTYFSNIREGKGFREVAKGPRKNAAGLTRGDRKRIAREAANDKARM